MAINFNRHVSLKVSEEQFSKILKSNIPVSKFIRDAIENRPSIESLSDQLQIINFHIQFLIEHLKNNSVLLPELISRLKDQSEEIQSIVDESKKGEKDGRRDNRKMYRRSRGIKSESSPVLESFNDATGRRDRDDESTTSPGLKEEKDFEYGL
jgi:hypothetical protein